MDITTVYLGSSSMAEIIRQRMTHAYSGELVVFLIGMRINAWWRIDQWWPVFTAMPKMLTELYRDPDSGFLGHRMGIGPGGPLVVQYWSSSEALYAYASNPKAEHRPAWTEFNRRVRTAPGTVGIWHETFQVERAESIYSGMPISGLAKATSALPVGPRSSRARTRHAEGATRPPAITEPAEPAMTAPESALTAS
jgi:hypothetical protein